MNIFIYIYWSLKTYADIQKLQIKNKNSVNNNINQIKCNICINSILYWYNTIIFIYINIIFN